MQLDLFSDYVRRPSTTIVVFPLSNRTHEVRSAASQLLALPARKDREKAWRSIARRLRCQLQLSGVSRLEAANQINAFRVAVACEARRQLIRGIFDDRGAA